MEVGARSLAWGKKDDDGWVLKIDGQEREPEPLTELCQTAGGRQCVPCPCPQCFPKAGNLYRALKGDGEG